LGALSQKRKKKEQFKTHKTDGALNVHERWVCAGGVGTQPKRNTQRMDQESKPQLGKLTEEVGTGEVLNV